MSDYIDAALRRMRLPIQVAFSDWHGRGVSSYCVNNRHDAFSIPVTTPSQREATEAYLALCRTLESQ